MDLWISQTLTNFQVALKFHRTRPAAGTLDFSLNNIDAHDEICRLYIHEDAQCFFFQWTMMKKMNKKNEEDEKFSSIKLQKVLFLNFLLFFYS